jgi:spore germination cell wall hydrolase CwlJ-like protein
MKNLLVCLVLSAGSVSAATKAEIVAATLISEAGGEKDPRAMAAIKEVIVTRSKKRKIGLDKVCLQNLQFSCWNGISEDAGVNKAKKHPKWKQAIQIAESDAETNYTFGADHYHTLKVSPSWTKKLKSTVTIQNHIFYR